MQFVRPSSPMRALACLSSLIFTASACYAQSGESACGTLYSPGQYGPFDYRTDKKEIRLVVDTHFPLSVELAFRGRHGDLGGGFDYTLRAIPNHPRALMALMRYGEKMGSAKPPGLRWTVECYFDRAMRFRPEDLIVRMIYATYLNGQGRSPEAIQQLDLVVAKAKDNPFTHYNAGLVYFDLKAYDKALQQAHKSTALGMTQTALRDQLEKAGKWAEPDGSAPAKQKKE